MSTAPRHPSMSTHSSSKPTISIVTAVYNGASSLEKTIESVARQLGREVEYVVIDGGSTDGTVDIIRKHSDVVACWVSEPDKGIYDAWNKGIRHARGDYISFVGADDVVHEDYARAYLDAVKSRPDVDYWCSKVVFDTSSPRIIGKPWKWSEFRRYMSVAHVGSLHSRHLYENFGLYDTSFRIVGDYEFLLRPAERLRAGYIDTVTVTMGAGGISNKHAFAALAETRKAKLLRRACGRATAHLDHAIAKGKCLIRQATL